MKIEISSNYKNILLGEFEFVIHKYRECSDPQDKLYFYSAFHATINRIINLEFSETLLFLHQILQISNTAFLQRLNASKSGDRTIKITEEMLELLITHVETICERIDKSMDLDDILIKINNLAYATTGNGYYLQEKGTLKF